MSQISEARQDSLFELGAGTALLAGEAQGAPAPVQAVSSAILAVRTKESVSKFPLRRPRSMGFRYLPAFFIVSFTTRTIWSSVRSKRVRR